MLLKIRQQLLPNKIKTTKARQRSTKKLPENYGKKISFHHQSVPFTLSVFFPRFRNRKSFGKTMWPKPEAERQDFRDLQKLHLLIKNPLARWKRFPFFYISCHLVLELPSFCAVQLKLKLITSMTRIALKL